MVALKGVKDLGTEVMVLFNGNEWAEGEIVEAALGARDSFTYTIKYADNAKTVLTERKLYAEVADGHIVAGKALQLPLHELHA